MKFKVTDYNGKSYSIEKLNDSHKSTAHDEDFDFENFDEKDVAAEDAQVCDKDEMLELDKADLKILKKLLEKADALLALVGDEKDNAEDPKEGKPDKAEKSGKGAKEEDLSGLDDSDDDLSNDEDSDEDEDEDDAEEDEEEVVDCDDSCDDSECDDVALCDSKKSFGSLQDSVKKTEAVDPQDEIIECWKKRYSK